MTITFRPARRENTPLIIGLAGPTKSGKTFSAHRLAVGLAQGGTVAMINAEGAKGHQYSDTFKYVAADLTAPFRPERYTEALNAALALKPRPAVVIIDSASHMHDGPGGLLEYHEDELDRMAGKTDYKKRDRMNWTAWIKPKAAENAFIYAMLSADCHIILCFRAKEKIKIVKGADPIELGWQPIAGERIAFETIFTLTLPPHSKGVPDLAASEMRTPFDEMIPAGRPLDEETGAALALWAAGSVLEEPGAGAGAPEIASPPGVSPGLVAGAPGSSSADEALTEAEQGDGERLPVGVARQGQQGHDPREETEPHATSPRSDRPGASASVSAAVSGDEIKTLRRTLRTIAANGGTLDAANASISAHADVHGAVSVEHRDWLRKAIEGAEVSV